MRIGSRAGASGPTGGAQPPEQPSPPRTARSMGARPRPPVASEKAGGRAMAAPKAPSGAGLRLGARVFRRRHARGVACALAGAGLWGFSGACAQFLLANYQVTPLFLTAVRMLGAGAIFLSVLAVRRRAQLAAMMRQRRTAGRLAVFGAAGLFFCQITYTVVIAYTNAGTATVLQTSGVAFVMLFACLLVRRPPLARELAGLVAALAATWLIATQGDPGALALPPLGLAWGVANGLSVAFYIMYPKRLFAQWGSFAVTGVGMLFGGVAAAAAYVGGAALGEPPALPSLDAAGALVFAAFVVVGTFAAFALYLHGVSVVGSVQGSLLGAVEPVSASLFSALWLGTAFSGADWAGLALMVAMVFLVTAGKPAPTGAAEPGESRAEPRG